jgi:hypothetical protein
VIKDLVGKSKAERLELAQTTVDETRFWRDRPLSRRGLGAALWVGPMFTNPDRAASGFFKSSSTLLMT